MPDAASITKISATVKALKARMAQNKKAALATAVGRVDLLTTTVKLFLLERPPRHEPYTC